MDADEHNAGMALAALCGHARHQHRPRAELTAADSVAIYARAALGRHRAGLSPRAFARLSRSALRQFARDHGLTAAEALLAQTMVLARLAVVRLPRLSEGVARERARRRLS